VVEIRTAEILHESTPSLPSSKREVQKFSSMQPFGLWLGSRSSPKPNADSWVRDQEYLEDGKSDPKQYPELHREEAPSRSNSQKDGG